MKALSIKQPWADLMLMGKKSIEIRTWCPKNMELPQDILIHAGKGIDKESMNMFRLNIPKERCGALLGVATLVRFKEYKTQEQFTADQHLHLNRPEWYDGKQVGFVFENVRKSAKIFPYKGQLNFFEVE